jgi:hypothetical protein
MFFINLKKREKKKRKVGAAIGTDWIRTVGFDLGCLDCHVSSGSQYRPLSVGTAYTGTERHWNQPYVNGK